MGFFASFFGFFAESFGFVFDLGFAARAAEGVAGLGEWDSEDAKVATPPRGVKDGIRSIAGEDPFCGGGIAGIQGRGTGVSFLLALEPGATGAVFGVECRDTVPVEVNGPNG